MKNKIDMEFVRPDVSGIAYFENCILPNVYQQLSGLEDFEDESVIVVGVLTGGRPAGAVVAQLFDDDDMLIHSIIVDENYRRMGVGTELLREIRNIGLVTLEPDYLEDPYPIDFYVHTEYALPEEERAGFEAFLEQAGFREYYDYPGLCSFPAERAAGLGIRSHDVAAAASVEDVTEDSLRAFFAESDLYPDPDLCFFTGSAEEPSCLMMAEEMGEGYYQVSSVKMNPDEDCEKELEALFRTLIASVREKTPDFTLIVNGEMNAENGFFEKLASEYGEIVRHREAGLYARYE